MSKRDVLSVLQEDGNFKLLEIKSINARTLLCWINTNDEIISVALFADEQECDEMDQKKLTEWGYPTHFVSNIIFIEEASQVVSLYLKDMEDKNFWWEKIKTNH